MFASRAGVMVETPSIGTIWRRIIARIGVAGLLAGLVWLACGVYTARFAYRGWIPHDEGTIGQSAARLLSGQVPHRDFDEGYTGGLTYLNAAAMRGLGMNLRAPRMAVFPFFLLFLASVYAITKRLLSSRAGLLMLALTTVWSLPNYFVSLPSWYNLFFATFTTLSLLRFLESRQRRWLWIAGACGGVSVLFKISGLFSLAAGVLFLAFMYPIGAQPFNAGRHGRSRFWLVLLIPSVLCALLIARLLAHRSLNLDGLQLFVPPLMVSLFLAWRERESGSSPGLLRLGHVAAMVGPFAGGAVVPLIAFAMLFWRQHALADLLRGVFILSLRQVTDAITSPPPLPTLTLAAPYALLLLAGRRRPLERESLIAAVLAILLGAWTIFSVRPAVYYSVWLVARALPPTVVAVGLWILYSRPAVSDLDPHKRAQVFLLVAMTAMFALIQFPFAAPIYFCYVAPMMMLTIVAIVSAQPRAPKRLHLSVAAFAFVFATIFMNPAYVWTLGFFPGPYDASARLDLERGGLMVPPEDKHVYEDLVLVLREHVGEGTIFAGPDCPEVYFLSGFPNPTRAIFDYRTPVREDDAWMIALLARAPIRAAVVNTKPGFSHPLDAGVLRVLELRFPSSQRIGPFVVRFE
jgi:hypothetical protein